MAIDEAILTARIESLVPNTLRFYRWKPSCVSLGKFQSIENEVHLDSCRKFGVDVVRRITGGGSVYHDSEGELTYSAVVSKKDLGTNDISAIYLKVYAGLAEGLRILGTSADFDKGSERACPNLTVNCKKISGSAQSHKKGIVLMHGTLLLDIDLKRMFSLLRVPWAKTCMDAVRVAKDKITSLKNELGREVQIVEAEQALVEGFGKTLKLELRRSTLTVYERELAEQLARDKYGTDQWNFHGRVS